MKKLFVFLSCFIAIYAKAQNVGIGTTTPSEKLEVKNNLRSTLKISSGSLSDTSQLLLSNRTSGTIGTDFSIKNIREEGLYISSLSDLPANNANNSLVILPGGNVGAGIIPTSKFHVDGNVKLEGSNIFEFGAGVAGKEVSAGKVGYNIFGQSALTFVGAGTNATNRAFYFYGEGGTTFNGPATVAGNLNLGGQIQVNGNPGTAKQVLTSNGSAYPTWQNTAYGNSTRFAVRFSANAAASGNTTITGTYYNLNTTDVVINSSSISINRSGLYHFDLGVSSRIIFASAPAGEAYPLYSAWLFFGPPNAMKLIDLKGMNRLSNAATAFQGSDKVSVEVYISAPAALSVYQLFSTLGLGVSTTSLSFDGFLSGHLIAD